MRHLFILSFVISLLLFTTACAATSSPSDHKAKTSGNATGDISLAELKSHEKFFKHHHAKLDDKAIEALKNIDQPIEITSYFGLWCHDSQREIPQLLDLLAAADNPNIQHHLIALNLEKKEAQNRQQADQVLYTPTIIVRSNGKELGRIVERPKVSLAADIIAFIEASSKAAP